MKIAYVCADPGVPVFGRKGCSVHVQEVSRAFLRSGASVTMLAASYNGATPAGLESLRTIDIPAPDRKLPDIERERRAIAANGATLQALDAAGPFDMLYERYSLWSFAGMEYARAAGIPGVLEVNAPLIEEQAAYRTLILRDAASDVARRAFGSASAIVAVSQGVADSLQAGGVDGDRLHVIPNGVDPRRFHPDVAPSCPAPDGAFTVGFAGTLKPWHGLETLAEAFGIAQQADPAFRLLIVGDGPRRSILEEALARAPHPERVIFTGALDPGRMPGMLASMDVAAAPYDDLPGFYFSPLKLFEYMACGRASVASAVGQIPEIIRHGATGLLCPPGDAGALAGALLRLRREPALRADIGNAARAYVTRNHTWDATARRVFEIAGSAAKGFA